MPEHRDTRRPTVGSGTGRESLLAGRDPTMPAVPVVGPGLTAAALAATVGLSASVGRLLAHWRGLGMGAVPCKTRLDPSAVPRALLPNMTLYERREPGVFHVRLVGTGIVERIGFDTTGSNYLDFVPGAGREQTRRFFDTLLDRPCGGYLIVEEIFAEGRQSLVELLRLPLAGADGRPRFLLSASEEIDVRGYEDPPPRPRLNAIARRADYVDMGSGLPASPPPFDLTLADRRGAIAVR